jgi:hypothetical protein
MDVETSSLYSRREKIVAASLFFTCLLLSTLTILLIIGITKAFILNGALEQVQEVVRTIDTKYGWVLGKDDHHTNETIVM